MAYRFQFRGDKEANWKGVILADREIGLLIRDNGKNTNLYKIGDGKTKWEDLPYFGFNGSISVDLNVSDGEETDKTVLSKKAVIDKFDAIDENISTLGGDIGTLGGDIGTLGEDISTLGEQLSGAKDDIININTELTTIKDNIGDKPEGYENIYTELTTIKDNIGDKPEGYENIYNELTDIKTYKYNTTVLSEQEYEEMTSNNGSGLHENTLYFVYE